MTYATLADIAESGGLALRGGFHPESADLVPDLASGRPPGTLLMLGWTGGRQWSSFTASPEYHDGQPNPLDRWSRRTIDAMANALAGRALYPFGGPPHLPFLRWAQRAEAVAPSRLGLLIHPDWGLWHAWRGALALPERLDLPARDTRPNPCTACSARPCLRATDFDSARAACPVGTPYSQAQAAFHRAAAGR
jgi:hypothetical protein